MIYLNDTRSRLSVDSRRSTPTLLSTSDCQLSTAVCGVDLVRRWGRLGQSGGSERVDHLDDAQAAAAIIARTLRRRERHDYQIGNAAWTITAIGSKKSLSEHPAPHFGRSQ